MNTKSVIRRVLFAILWICIGGGMLTLLIAAISKKNKELCIGYNITIKSNSDSLFVDKNDITHLLTDAVGTNLNERKITEIDLHQLEQLLEKNIWISDAELWFDNQNKLQVYVTEREPVARIFTTESNSFYIDSNEVRMPLSDKLSVRVPVFTNFPDKKLKSSKDSLLLDDVKKIALFIRNDPFWMSQVAQIDINGSGNFEMIPVVGNHLVKFGNASDIDKKFNRLMALYKQVLSKSGFDIYSTIDVEYAGQVIGTKRGSEKSTVDSARLRANVEKLLRQSLQLQNDSVDAEKPVIEKQKSQSDSVKVTTTESVNQVPEKSKTLSQAKENKPDENKPKAVMPKKN